MNSFGSQTMAGELKHVFVCPPVAEIGTADIASWNYTSAVDSDEAAREHAAFVMLLEDKGVDVTPLPGADGSGLMDAMFAHDASLVTRHGAVLMRMGKVLRRGEERLHEKLYETLGIPIIGRISEPATLEAGDCLWIREDLLAIGRGFRTNDEGIEQIRALLEPLGIRIRAYDLSSYSGPKACLHLMSIVNFLSHDVALVVRPLLPVALGGLFDKLGIETVDAPMDEFDRSNGISANILALGSRRCVMVDGFPATKAAIEARGCELDTYSGREISIKAEGGPTCLTRPLLRL